MKPLTGMTDVTRVGLRRRAALAWPLVLPAGLLAGTPGVDEPPAPLPPRPLPLPALTEQRLANGLTLVVAQRAGLPLVSITLLVRAGAETDPLGRAGVAAMTSTLWSKGALRAGRPVPAAELARQAEALGGGIETGSSWGASTLSMTVSSPKLDPALSLLTDLLRHPMLADAELERARAQALDGLRVTLGNPSEVAALALRRVFWGDSPYGRVAPPAAIKRLRRADMLAFQRQWVRPDRVALVLVGDVTTVQAQALAQRLLGDWRAKAGAWPMRALALAPPAPLDAPLVLIDMPGSGQSGVAVAAPYLGNSAAEAPGRYAGLVANAVLGGGYSARLNQEVRIKRGLSYGAGSSAESHPSGGMFSAHAQTDHPSAAEVLQILRAEITRLADAAPGADELAARQATLVGSFARRLETTGGLAALLVGQIAQGRPLAELSTYSAGLLAVSTDQVRAFARRFWQPGSLRAVVAGDLAAAGEGLSKAAQPQALRLTVGKLDLEQQMLGAVP